MRFTINEKEYNAKEFDFNLICDLEDMGVQLSEAENKPMSMVRAYVSLCIGKSRELAGKEMEQHLIKGGNFEDVTEAMGKMMEESDFFRSLNKTTQTEVGTSQEEKNKAK